MRIFDGGFYRVEFKGCKIIGSRFDESSLNNISFKDCLGKYINLSFSTLKEVEFKDCDLTGAVIQEAKLKKKIFKM